MRASKQRQGEQFVKSSLQRFEQATEARVEQEGR